MHDEMRPDPSDGYAICVSPIGDGRQQWELLDTSGERVMHGEAADQASALAMAQSAASAMGA
jgi:hypothetical protein